MRSVGPFDLPELATSEPVPGEGDCCFREAIDCEGDCRLKPNDGPLLEVHDYADVYHFGGRTRAALGSLSSLTRQRQRRVGR